RNRGLKTGHDLNLQRARWISSSEGSSLDSDRMGESSTVPVHGEDLVGHVGPDAIRLHSEDGCRPFLRAEAVLVRDERESSALNLMFSGGPANLVQLCSTLHRPDASTPLDAPSMWLLRSQ